MFGINFRNKNKAFETVEKKQVSFERLEKAKVSLDKHLVSLKKEKSIDLTNITCRVQVLLDISGSMKYRYEKGLVQDALTRLFPLALKFDDDGQMEVAIFDEGCCLLEPMTMDNYATYVKKEIIGKGHRPFSGTNYAPAIRQATKGCIGSPYPTFTLFMTDGGCYDKSQSDQAFRESAEHQIFFQCIGIGDDDDFDYLEKIDNLSGRKVDNTAFINLGEVENGATKLFMKNCLSSIHSGCKQ